MSTHNARTAVMGHTHEPSTHPYHYTLHITHHATDNARTHRGLELAGEPCKALRLLEGQRGVLRQDLALSCGVMVFCLG